MKLEFHQIFEKYTNVKFHVNLSEFRMDGQTDVTKLIVSFHNFADVPNNTVKLEITQSSLIIFIKA